MTVPANYGTEYRDRVGYDLTVDRRYLQVGYAKTKDVKRNIHLCIVIDSTFARINTIAIVIVRHSSIAVYYSICSW